MIQADIRQTALKGRLSGFWWGVGGSVGGYGRASASSRTGQAAMEWNFGRGARVTERTGSASRSAAVPPSPHVHLATVVGQGA
jgi:hypothetical protein